MKRERLTKIKNFANNYLPARKGKFTRVNKFKFGFFKPRNFVRRKREFRFRKKFYDESSPRARIGKAFIVKELFLKKFLSLTYLFFKENPALEKKVVMHNYWEIFKKFTEPNFSFTFSGYDSIFYLGVARSYTRSTLLFMRSFLGRLKLKFARRRITRARYLSNLYKIYKISGHIMHLFHLFKKPLKRPDFFFKGYQSVLKVSFFRFLSIFSMKIFILANKIFSNRPLRIRTHAKFFYLWKKVYKGWLNAYYTKPTSYRAVPQAGFKVFAAARNFILNAKRKNTQSWREHYLFRADLVVYKRVLTAYLFKLVRNFGAVSPYRYRVKRPGFRYSILGKKIFLNKKKKHFRKSQKNAFWFKRLVKEAYYFSRAFARETFFRGGYGRVKWGKRKSYKQFFKMKFVFIKYFSKKFGIKNKTEFLKKAQLVVRKRGGKWMRYHREFESRLLRVLVLFGFCSNDAMSKDFISSNWVIVNNKILNYACGREPRAKMGDVVSLSNAAAVYVLKKNLQFFKKKWLVSWSRTGFAKVTYKLFKKYFLEWALPSAYSITGTFIKHGFSALMGGPLVRSSKMYYSFNRFIPIYNRVLFKIFIQKFVKKLN